MSEVELKQELDTAKAQLDQSNNMLKVANAKHSAANHSLGVALGESNDVKAANILYQEREKELMSKVQELTFKIQCLESKLVELEKENADLRKQLAELKQTPSTPEEPAHTDHLEL
jgi:chromosome segregation ATPase